MADIITTKTEKDPGVFIPDEPTNVCMPDFRLAFEAMPGSAALLSTDAPKYTMLAVSDVYLSHTGTTRKQVIGKSVFDTFAANPRELDCKNQSILHHSLQQAITFKTTHTIPAWREDYPYKDGDSPSNYWMAVNKPVLGPDGNVCYIIHTVEEVTDVILLRQQEQKIKGIEQA